MEFKIDTNNTFSTITPVISAINAKLAGIIREKCTEMRQSGSHNLIIDLRECAEIDNGALLEFISMHEESYSNNMSLVYSGLNDKVLTTVKAEEADLMLNIAPTMQEAIDIVSMEVLERELLSEE